MRKRCDYCRNAENVLQNQLEQLQVGPSDINGANHTEQQHATVAITGGSVNNSSQTEHEIIPVRQFRTTAIVDVEPNQRRGQKVGHFDQFLRVSNNVIIVYQFQYRQC